MGRVTRLLRNTDTDPSVADRAAPRAAPGVAPAAHDDLGVFSFIAPGTRLDGAGIDSPEGTVVIAGDLIDCQVTCKRAVVLSSGSFVGDMNCSESVRVYGTVRKSSVRAGEVFIYASGTVDADTQISATRVGTQVGAALDAAIRTNAGNSATPFLISDEDAA